MRKVERAIVSVSDKSGVEELGEGLAAHGVEILSTGGTAARLAGAGVEVIEVSEYTGFPEMMDGRVKTLHPKIHGGLLAVRDDEGHAGAMTDHGIGPIDIVVVNLYPFEATVAREGCSFADAIENIDIGGPSMIRSAANNHRYVTVLTDPVDYPLVLEELEKNGGAVSDETRLRLAKKAFSLTARYDGAIAGYLTSLREDGSRSAFPEVLTLQVEKAQDCRYGENPHQRAAFYVEKDAPVSTVSGARQLQGKELSFNNIIDFDGAVETVKEFEETAAIVIKHTNPCGAAISAVSLADAYRKARATDPVSAFGGVVALNREVDAETAEELKSTFLEGVIAPGFSEEARKILKKKKNLRLLQVDLADRSSGLDLDIKKVAGGLLCQTRDLALVPPVEWKTVTRRPPTEEELSALFFGWKIVKHVKSNAIVYCNKDQVVGVGAGQMSRVDSSKIAVMKAELPIKGTVICSDAFFPFRDGVDAAAEAGATAVIEPGGSIRDEEVIAAADEHGMAMVFTGMRHFRH